VAAYYNRGYPVRGIRPRGSLVAVHLGVVGTSIVLRGPNCIPQVYWMALVSDGRDEYSFSGEAPKTAQGCLQKTL